LTRNTAATFDVFYWLQITNFDAFLFNPAPSGLDYNDVWPLYVHAQNASGVSPNGEGRKVDNGICYSVHFYFRARWQLFVSPTLRLFEIALVFVRFDHIASVIVNADHSVM